MISSPDWIAQYRKKIEKNRKLFEDKTHRPFVTRDASRKFSTQGTARPFYGWSLVHFFTHESDRELVYQIHETYKKFYDMVTVSGVANTLAMLPPSTYHMTLVGIATNQSDSIQHQIIEGVRDAFRLFKKEKIQAPRICVRGDISTDGSTFIAPVEPLDKESLDTLYFIRSEIRKRLHPLGNDIVRNIPENFHGHVTLAYIIKPLSKTYYQKMKEILKTFGSADPLGTAEINTISLHRFETMVDWGSSIIDLELEIHRK